MFLNYQKFAICLSKDEARKEIQKLITQAPASFEEFLDYLLEDISK